MDFWHCHKPDIPKGHTTNGGSDDHPRGKGYGANNRFTARRGTGFVDLTYFLLHKDDCHGIKVGDLQFVLLSDFSHSFYGYQEGGHASECFQWSGHRYTYPILISCSILLLQQQLLSTLFFDYGLLNLLEIHHLGISSVSS